LKALLYAQAKHGTQAGAHRSQIDYVKLRRPEAHQHRTPKHSAQLVPLTHVPSTQLEHTRSVEDRCELWTALSEELHSDIYAMLQSAPPAKQRVQRRKNVAKPAPPVEQPFIVKPRTDALTAEVQALVQELQIVEQRDSTERQRCVRAASSEAFWQLAAQKATTVALADTAPAAATVTQDSILSTSSDTACSQCHDSAAEAKSAQRAVGITTAHSEALASSTKSCDSSKSHCSAVLSTDSCTTINSSADAVVCKQSSSSSTQFSSDKQQHRTDAAGAVVQLQAVMRGFKDRSRVKLLLKQQLNSVLISLGGGRISKVCTYSSVFVAFWCRLL
jgi:hypothetical protein